MTLGIICSAHEWFFKGATGLMDDTSPGARYCWYSRPVGVVKDSFGWRKIEHSLAVVAADSQLHRPPAAKYDLEQGNIFSQRPCLQFRRPGHMLWNEVGRQTKWLVICPHCVAIDLLLLVLISWRGLQAPRNRRGRRGGGHWLVHQKKGSWCLTSQEAQLLSFATIVN